MATPLDARHLRTLSALRHLGNLSRAAQWLHLTQSALSCQIKLLEDHYGTTLFERKSAPLSFSPAGLRLLQLADAVLPLMDEAERDISRLLSGHAGSLRIAVECHTCFDWLMPAMDALRARWPEVELDIVSGFQADPVGLLHQNLAELAIVSECDANETQVTFHPLFSFEMVALLPKRHALLAKPYLEAADFADQTLITYPVPDDMLDVVQQVLQPAGIAPKARRTSELTVAILQLVASGRGLAVLPLWAVKNYLDRDYVTSLCIGERGLHSQLFAATPAHLNAWACLNEFIEIMRETSIRHLPGVNLI